MDTNRLSKEMCEILNAQMTKEAHASQVYLSFAVWADDKGYQGISNFLFRHAQEERNHMMKFLTYILERGAKPVIQPIPGPMPDPASVYDCFQKAFDSEVSNTTAIYDCIDVALKEKDWITYNFLQWFVKEQNEEETLIMNMLDKIKIAGSEKAADEILYVLDRDLKSEPDEAELAREKTAENP